LEPFPSEEQLGLGDEAGSVQLQAPGQCLLVLPSAKQPHDPPNSPLQKPLWIDNLYVMLAEPFAMLDAGARDLVMTNVTLQRPGASCSTTQGHATLNEANGLQMRGHAALLKANRLEMEGARPPAL
jgi:hypothetical protein